MKKKKKNRGNKNRTEVCRVLCITRGFVESEFGKRAIDENIGSSETFGEAIFNGDFTELICEACHAWCRESPAV